LSKIFEKILNMKERLLKMIDYLELSVRSFESVCGLQRGNISNMTEKSTIGSDKLAKIIDVFPIFNVEWLLTGQGEMLRKATPNAADSEKKDKVCEKCAEKDKTIEAMQTTIATQATLIEYLKEMNGSLDVAQKKSSAASLPLNE
jgi:polyhydroxyalkanoate synthesis regulator protein